MLKSRFWLMFTILILVSSILASSQIVEKKNEDTKPIDALRSVPKLKMNHDNSASATDDKVSLTIDKFMSKSNENVKLKIDAVSSVNELCFEFPVDLSMIRMNEIRKKVPLWFDTDLKTDEKKSKNKICYSNQNVLSEEFYYNMQYLGIGIIKYNITMDGTVLDPYLIGQLANSSQLSIRMPFDNNINVVWSYKADTLVSANTRTLTADTFTYLGECSNPTNANDLDWDSYSTDSNSAHTSSGCEYYWTYNKLANDTGASWNVKDGFSEENLSIPNECWQADASILRLKAYSLKDDMTNFGYSYWLCYNGVTYQSLRQRSGIGGVAYQYSFIYEQRLFMTNQSSFSNNNQRNVTTEYLNLNGLLYSGSFRFWGNDSVNAQKNDLNLSQSLLISSGVVYNTTGASFNGINSYAVLP